MGLLESGFPLNCMEALSIKVFLLNFHGFPVLLQLFAVQPVWFSNDLKHLQKG